MTPTKKQHVSDNSKPTIILTSKHPLHYELDCQINIEETPTCSHNG